MKTRIFENNALWEGRKEGFSSRFSCSMRVLALLALLALQLPLVAALDNGLALVPPRGWRSWNQVYPS